MADIPDAIVLNRHRDFVGRRYAVWPRWLGLGLITLFCVLGLANVFGQRPTTSTRAVPAAKLTLYAPTRLRGGLLFSARFHLSAQRELKNAILVLDPGWAEGMAINTIEPSPLGEASKNGRLSLQLGHIPAGESHILYRFPRARPVLEGEPIVIVQDGELIARNLRRERVTPEEVAEAGRTNGVAHLSEVRWAVLETNGTISFIKKSA